MAARYFSKSVVQICPRSRANTPTLCCGFWGCQARGFSSSALLERTSLTSRSSKALETGFLFSQERKTRWKQSSPTTWWPVNCVLLLEIEIYEQNTGPGLALFRVFVRSSAAAGALPLKLCELCEVYSQLQHLTFGKLLVCATKCYTLLLCLRCCFQLKL